MPAHSSSNDEKRQRILCVEVDPLSLIKKILCHRRMLDQDGDAPMNFLVSFDGRWIGNKEHSVALSLVALDDDNRFSTSHIYPLGIYAIDENYTELQRVVGPMLRTYGHGFRQSN